MKELHIINRWKKRCRRLICFDRFFYFSTRMCEIFFFVSAAFKGILFSVFGALIGCVIICIASRAATIGTCWKAIFAYFIQYTLTLSLFLFYFYLFSLFSLSPSPFLPLFLSFSNVYLFDASNFASLAAMLHLNIVSLFSPHSYVHAEYLWFCFWPGALAIKRMEDAFLDVSFCHWLHTASIRNWYVVLFLSLVLSSDFHRLFILFMIEFFACSFCFSTLILHPVFRLYCRNDLLPYVGSDA